MVKFVLVVLLVLSLQAEEKRENVWLFKKGPAYDETWDDSKFSEPDFDDSSWQEVNVPEDWGRLKHRYNPKYKCHVCQRGHDKGFHPGHYGYGWYRLHLRIPKEWEGESVTLYMGKINRVNVEVFFNGKKISKDFPHYTHTQIYQLSPEYINYGKDNVIAIRCGSDHKYPTAGGITEGPLKIVSKKGVIFLPSTKLHKVKKFDFKKVRIKKIKKFEIPQSGLSYKFGEIKKDENAASPSYQFYVMNERVIGCGNFQKSFSRFNFRIPPFYSIIRRFKFAFEQNGKEYKTKYIAIEDEFITTPESSFLTYKTRDFEVKEIIFCPREIPGTIILLDINIKTTSHLKIKASFLPIYQLYWPLQKIELHEECFWSKELNAWVFTTEEDDRYWTLVGVNKENLSYMCKAKEYLGFEEEYPIIIKVRPEEVKDEYIAFFICSTIEGKEDLYKNYLKLTKNIKNHYLKTTKYYRDFLKNTLSIRTPNKWIDYAWNWYKIRSLNSFIRTPGLGRSMWESIYEDSGYHYFGWGHCIECKSVLLSFLPRRIIKEYIEFWFRPQGKEGKARGLSIFEITPSPIIHNKQKIAPRKDFGLYHAVPGPIYGIYKYLMWTDDREFVGKLWRNLDNGIHLITVTLPAEPTPPGAGEFCFRMPEIFEKYKGKKIVHPKFWSKYGTLLMVEKAKEVAKILAKEEKVKEWEEYLKKEKGSLKELDKWWDKEKDWPLWLATEEGEHVLTVPTIEHLHGLMFSGLLPKEKIERLLKRINSPEFTTDFGAVWYSSRKDPLSSRMGYTWATARPWYNTDSVCIWNYRYHYPEEGYKNLLSLVNLVKNSADSPEAVIPTKKGYRYNNCHFIGGTFILWPIVKGLLGITPEAPYGKFVFKPHLPWDWQFAEIKNLKIGDSLFDISVSKSTGTLTIEIIRKKGKKINTVVLSPAFPAMTEIKKVKINGKKIDKKKIKIIQKQQCLHPEIEVPLTQHTKVVYEHK